MSEKFLIVLILIFIAPIFVSAHNVEIKNNISTSASTGGNTAEKGKVIEGTSKSSVNIHTEVNGKVIEDFQKEIQGEEKFNYKVKKEFNGDKFDESKVETKVKISINNVAKNPLFPTNKVSRGTLDTFKETVKEIIKYVFSFFKF